MTVIESIMRAVRKMDLNSKLIVAAIVSAVLKTQKAERSKKGKSKEKGKERSSNDHSR